jgi:hypothetical protein
MRVEQDTWRVLSCLRPSLHKASFPLRGIKVPQLRNVPLHILRSRLMLCTVLSFLKNGVAIIAVRNSLCIVYQREPVFVWSSNQSQFLYTHITENHFLCSILMRSNFCTVYKWETFLLCTSEKYFVYSLPVRTSFSLVHQ